MNRDSEKTKKFEDKLLIKGEARGNSGHRDYHHRDIHANKANLN